MKDDNIRVTGTSQWVNQETGEVRKTLNAEIDLEGQKNKRKHSFLICVLPYIIKLTDIVGNKKMKVVSYILDNMALKGEYANSLIITQRELAKKADVSIQTVSTTLNILEEAEIIKKKTGAIMIHPRVAMWGGAKKENSLLVRFKNFDEDENPNINDHIKTKKTPNQAQEQ